ncbi:putative transposon-encoded protein [Methanococcus voltae]|uniref:DUF2080 family transposase-associated protein n=1 Tax=Methanococcus voltae TaxID=2188 RepID=UPI001AE46DAE|nr:DUF2080 family transposase-associated protein [Methanococcus voltae]MBP2143818.1 putative transposon-encoded protein [Methanococcus voltae]
MMIVHQQEGVIKPLGQSGRVQPAIPARYIGKKVIVQVIGDEEEYRSLKEDK